jgi:hypothetical protein
MRGLGARFCDESFLSILIGFRYLDAFNFLASLFFSISLFMAKMSNTRQKKSERNDG